MKVDPDYQEYMKVRTKLDAQLKSVTVQIVYRPKMKWAKYTVFAYGKRIDGHKSLNSALNHVRLILDKA